MNSRSRPRDLTDDSPSRRFPSGHLAEEREVLWIQALAAGDADAARVRADAFRRAYPRSIFRPAVDALAP